MRTAIFIYFCVPGIFAPKRTRYITAAKFSHAAVLAYIRSRLVATFLLIAPCDGDHRGRNNGSVREQGEIFLDCQRAIVPISLTPSPMSQCHSMAISTLLISFALTSPLSLPLTIPSWTIKFSLSSNRLLDWIKGDSERRKRAPRLYLLLGDLLLKTYACSAYRHEQARLHPKSKSSNAVSG